MIVTRMCAGKVRRRLLISVAVFAAAPAQAQRPPEKPSDIVITGSRLPAGVRAPTPLTVIGTLISDILLAWADPRIRMEG